jgi:outer membrane protein OmpA-like peptidoglycan-associated protein
MQAKGLASASAALNDHDMASSSLSRDDNDNDAAALVRTQERDDNLLIGGGLLVAALVVLGALAQTFGWFNGSEADWKAGLAPVVTAMAKTSTGEVVKPTRIRVQGTVAKQVTKDELLKTLDDAFPKVPVEGDIRVKEDAKPEMTNVGLRIEEKFGDVKRFGFAWRNQKFYYQGAFYDDNLVKVVEKTVASLPKENAGENQSRVAERPAIDPAVLSANLRAKLEGKVVEFDVGADTLTPAGAAVLDSLVDDVKVLTGLRVMVAGHTDTDGDPQQNQTLSLARAQAVVRYLAAKGADAKRFQAEGFGGKQPKVPNDTPENKQINRRVELFAREVE